MVESATGIVAYMSQRRDIETRLALYQDLKGIFAAMRSFALTELQRVNKRENAQQQVMQALKLALDDLVYARIALPTPIYDICLVLGSVRGFCGSFNDDVLACWQQQCSKDTPTILIGERLHEAPQNNMLIKHMPGATGSLDALMVMESILSAIAEIRSTQQGESGLIVCIRDDNGARIERLWPLPDNPLTSTAYPPFTYAPPAKVAAGVAEHYLFHDLLTLLLRSIRVENHMRLMQMENALRHLERDIDELQRLNNRLRQEEIVEEIELMIGARKSSGK